MARGFARAQAGRVLIAAAAVLALAVASLEHPGRSRAASEATRSSHIAVIPGLSPAAYPGTRGVPPLPVNDPELAAYHFGELPANQVTAAALSSYDTVFLYGIRWGDIPASGQAAINAFAITHKVVIWDADDTGAQAYSTFVHPFSTLSSGEHGSHGASVVTYPAITNPLASDDSSNPAYLDPNQMVTDQHMIAHMNAMLTTTHGWVPALGAANKEISDGGWAVAWTYGSIGNGTGFVAYSGIDSDSLIADTNPNYALKELALDLAAPFRQTPAACAPNCKLPTDGGGGQTYAACNFAKPVPTHWVRGRVPILVRTSFASGITAQVITRTGRVVASGREANGNLVWLKVQTKRLISNRISQLQAVVFVKGQRACAKGFRLKVDNIPPKIVTLSTTSTARAHVLTLRLSEHVRLQLIGRHLHRSLRVPGLRLVHVNLPASVKKVRLIARDRAGNTIGRRLRW